MTRKEAIKEIEERVQITEHVGGSYVDCVDIEALRMAVSILQQSDHIADGGKKDDHFRDLTKKMDVISRQAAKLKVARVIWEDGDSCHDFHDKCVDCLDDVPPAQPEQTDCIYCHEDSDGYVTPLEKNCHAFIRFGMNGWELSLKANGWHGSAKIRYCPMCGRDLLVK